MSDSSKTITRASKRFFSGTLISRATGLGREVVMAAVFGATPIIAAFWMAFRFAYLLRRVFGEGALHAAFVPHYESLRQTDPAKGARFFYDLSNALTLVLLALVFIAEVVLGSFLWFGSLSEANYDVVRLTMVFLPALIFICLYALNTSLLNCERTYFLPSVAPAALNLIWMGAVAFLWRFSQKEALLLLAMIITLAFAVQWFVTQPAVMRYLSANLQGNQHRFSSREILRILRPFALGIIGVTATQINSALDALFARAADSEGPAYLWYAIRIQQLPLALFGVGMSGALLPPIARAAKNGEWEQYRHFMSFALKRIVVFMVPLSFAIFTLGLSGITLVYGHGAFSDSAIFHTTRCLFSYGVGLLPMTMVLVVAAGFYARKDYKIPTFWAVTTVGANIGLNALFVFGFHWGASSVAIATSVAAAVNAFALVILLKDVSLDGLAKTFVKALCCSVVAAGATIFLSHILFPGGTWAWVSGDLLGALPRAFVQQLYHFVFEAGCFVAFLLGAAFFVRMDPFLTRSHT